MFVNKTKIEWCDSTWNPVTGCLHECKYCYARGIAERFGGRWDNKLLRNVGGDGCKHELDTNLMRHTTGKNRYVGVHSVVAPFPFAFDPTLHRYRMEQPANEKKAQTIFVCSMADLFGDWVPNGWINEVFDACKNAPQHRYLFLTKNPKCYTDYGVPLEDNMWYGTSVTTESDMQKLNLLPAFANVFVSMEPILEDLRPEIHNVNFKFLNWIIIGAETGKRKDKVIPKVEWVEKIVQKAKEHNIPVFMKESLVPIVGEENMKREFPW